MSQQLESYLESFKVDIKGLDTIQRKKLESYLESFKTQAQAKYCHPLGWLESYLESFKWTSVSLQLADFLP